METPSGQNEGPSLQNILSIMSGSFEGDTRNTNWEEKRSALAILLQCYLMQQSEDENPKWIMTYSERFRKIFNKMLPENAGEMPQYPGEWVQCLEERLYEKNGWEYHMMLYEKQVYIHYVLQHHRHIVVSFIGMQMQVLLKILEILSPGNSPPHSKSSTPPTG